MTSDLLHVLEATGYVADGVAGHGVLLGEEARLARRRRDFEPDALWRGSSSLTVYFKVHDTSVSTSEIEQWRREIWNEGIAPLLWLVSPGRVQLFNAFARPVSRDDLAKHRLRTFKTIARDLEALDNLAGRLAMETGQFWTRATRISRKTSVDAQLLGDLAALERDLVQQDLDRGSAQGLIGRAIFTQYLIDRQIVTSQRLAAECGAESLPEALRDTEATGKLFSFLADSFNGDMFPKAAATEHLRPGHLTRVADFLEATDPESGQLNFFPYRFDIIPVELISSIYEQFAHSKTGVDAEAEADPDSMGEDVPEPEPEVATPAQSKRRGVHYTRLPIVSLILDEVMDDLHGGESVLDLTCGSGVFLVEAFRRLVAQRGGEAPPRDLIRSTLYEQIFGVDISDAAIRVAAFSLYLAALELDPNPQPPEALKFERLIGRTLLVGDARTIEQGDAGAPLLAADGKRRSFDIIVGNPPWTFRGRSGTRDRNARSHASKAPKQPRGEGLDFVMRATEFSHGKTRYGIVLSAMPFFAGSKTGVAAVQHVVRTLSPVTLVNLAAHTSWLFPTASMPAMVLLAKHRPQRADQLTVVNVPWSPSAEKSYTFTISPSDVTSMPLGSWAKDAQRLKATVSGHGRDIVLLENMRARYVSLGNWLGSIGSRWRDGLILGKAPQRTRDASHLFGLDTLETNDLQHFQVPTPLQPFEHEKAQWPRSRETYEAPLLLIKEFFRSGPRAIAAVAERDLVYTDAYFGAAVGKEHRQSAHLMAAILSSAFASWFFLMTAAEFGLWKRRLLTSDVGLLPIPALEAAVRSEAGQRILELEERARRASVDPKTWDLLDAAVFDLYELDDADRLVVKAGFDIASRQWLHGRKEASRAADTAADLMPYAQAFQSGVDVWLESAGQCMRAEILDMSAGAPLRIVRFLLDDRSDVPSVRVVPVQGDLSSVIKTIGERLDVRLGSALVGERELRVHGAREIVMIKPAARRFWSTARALDDADAVVAESFTGTAG